MHEPGGGGAEPGVLSGLDVCLEMVMGRSRLKGHSSRNAVDRRRCSRRCVCFV